MLALNSIHHAEALMKIHHVCWYEKGGLKQFFFCFLFHFFWRTSSFIEEGDYKDTPCFFNEEIVIESHWSRILSLNRYCALCLTKNILFPCILINNRAFSHSSQLIMRFLHLSLSLLTVTAPLLDFAEVIFTRDLKVIIHIKTLNLEKDHCDVYQTLFKETQHQFWVNKIQDYFNKNISLLINRQHDALNSAIDLFFTEDFSKEKAVITKMMKEFKHFEINKILSSISDEWELIELKQQDSLLQLLHWLHQFMMWAAVLSTLHLCTLSLEGCEVSWRWDCNKMSAESSSWGICVRFIIGVTWEDWGISKIKRSSSMFCILKWSLIWSEFFLYAIQV